MKRRIWYFISAGIVLIALILLWAKEKSLKVETLPAKPVKAIWSLDGEGSNYTFYRPRDVEVDQEGNIYVLDTGNNRIMKYDKYGKFLAQIGSVGKGPGEFVEPQAFCIKKKKIYTLDWGNSRIQIFSTQGMFERSIQLGSKPLPMVGIIKVDSEGKIYVNSLDIEENGLITVYSPTGEKLGVIGELSQRRDRFFRHINTVIFDFDSTEEHLYMFFTGAYLFCKYKRDNEEWKLVFKKSIKNVPEIQEMLYYWRKYKRTNKPPSFAVLDIALSPVDKKIIATVISAVYTFTVEGKTINRFHLLSPTRERTYFAGICTDNQGFLYGVDNISLTVFKYRLEGTY